MKNNIYKRAFIVFFALAGTCFTSCEDIEDLPPLTNTTYINKSYKLQAPQELTVEDLAEFNSIKAEYDTATN